jgi:hypothetical protein
LGHRTERSHQEQGYRIQTDFQQGEGNSAKYWEPARTNFMGTLIKVANDLHHHSFLY